MACDLTYPGLVIHEGVLADDNALVIKGPVICYGVHWYGDGNDTHAIELGKYDGGDFASVTPFFRVVNTSVARPGAGTVFTFPRPVWLPSLQLRVKGGGTVVIWVDRAYNQGATWDEQMYQTVTPTPTV